MRTLKLLMIIGALLALSSPALAAQLQVSGVVRSGGGGAVADGNYILFVTLYDAEKATKGTWSETLKSVSVSGGFFSATLGAGDTKLPDATFGGDKPLWIGVQVGNEPELPRAALHHVPRAVHAQVAAGLACSGCVTGGAIGAGAISAKHVGFLYAGSDTKGGAAKVAVSALKAQFADKAKEADIALAANTAKNAENAKNSQSSLVAKALQCTGCVGLAHLGKDVAGGFLSTKGGAIKGTVGIDGKLSLGKSDIVGGKFAATDVTKAKCDVSNGGQVLFDAKLMRMFLCTGSAWERFRTCSTACKAKAKVPCGQPIPDDCGDHGTCSGTGTFCSTGSCNNGVCGVGTSPASAMASCKAILAKVPTSKDGTYWINPNGAQAYEAYCDMSGGGWTRLVVDAQRHGKTVSTHKAIAGGTFTQVRATHKSGFVACSCSSKDTSYPWQACNPSHGDVYSLEFKLNGTYLVKQSSWSVLPSGCAKPKTKTGPIVCSKSFTSKKGDGWVATWQEPSNNVSTSDNCGTQVVDIWGR